MFNEKDVDSLEQWEAEYSNPDLGVFMSNLVQSPLSVGSKAINVGESFTRMVAEVLPSGAQDVYWGPWVIGSRLVSVGLNLASNLSIASHKSNSPFVNALSRWHSLWCSPYSNPIPSDWKLIMEAGEDNKYGSGYSHVIDDYVKAFIIQLGDELKGLEDSEVISQSVQGLRYRLKKSEYTSFQIDTSTHPFSDELSASMLLIISPSREFGIIRSRNVLRVVGSRAAHERIYKLFTQQVISIAGGKAEVYRFSDNMTIKLSDFSNEEGLKEDLSNRIAHHPPKLAFLAVGKPGTGKTQFSMCLAREVLIEQGYVVVIASVSDLLSFRPPNWMKRVAIICNDADLLLLSRESNLNRWGSMSLGDIETCMQLLDNTLSKSLTPVRLNDIHFDEAEQTSMVYIITSNIEPGNIDPALMRPGRIDVKGEFSRVYDSAEVSNNPQ